MFHFKNCQLHLQTMRISLMFSRSTLEVSMASEEFLPVPSEGWMMESWMGQTFGSPRTCNFFQVIFFWIGISWNQTHHFSPPFGTICLEFLPSTVAMQMQENVNMVGCESTRSSRYIHQISLVWFQFQVSVVWFQIHNMFISRNLGKMNPFESRSRFLIPYTHLGLYPNWALFSSWGWVDRGGFARCKATKSEIFCSGPWNDCLLLIFWCFNGHVSMLSRYITSIWLPSKWS